MNLQIKYRPVSELVPYANNARKHDEKNVAEIAAAISKYGFLDPVAVDKNGVLVWGHGRVLAAKQLNISKIPVIALPSDLTDDELKALRLQHNKLAEKSGWDVDKLAAELDALDVSGFDVGSIGFSDKELDELLGSLGELEVPTFAPANPPAPMVQPTPAAPPPNLAAYTTDEIETPEDTAPPSYGPAPQAKQPNASDDEYSQFALTMLHDNKRELLDVLNEVRTAHELEKLEDALMLVVRAYKV